MVDALGASWSTVLGIVLNAIIVYVSVIVFTRIAGLRSFAKMSGFDFAMTVAIGSVIASTVASASISALQGVVALASIYTLQLGVAAWRARSDAADVVDNSPLLLMAGQRVLEHNMRTGNVTMSELRAKLREANVLSYSQIRAVVLESTGDVSVLHTSDGDVELELDLFEGVRDASELRAIS